MAELTHLIADYKNALLRHCGPGTPQMNSLTRNGSHRSIRKTLPHSSPSTLPHSHPHSHSHTHPHAHSHTTMTLSDRNATLTLSSHTSTFPHMERIVSHGQPDILKSTPDHKKRSQDTASNVA